MTMNYDLARSDTTSAAVDRTHVLIVIPPAGSDPANPAPPIIQRVADLLGALTQADIGAAKLADIPQTVPTDGLFLRYTTSGLDWTNIAEDHLSPDVAGRLLPSTGTFGYYLVWDGSTWVVQEITKATEDVRGGLEIATVAEAVAGSLDDKIITPRKMIEGLDGLIAPHPVSSSNANKYLRTDSQGHLQYVDAGADGTDGKDATVEVRYLRNNSSSAPNAPVGDNPAGWGTTALIPTTSARYVWRALRSGTSGALSAWMVTLASYLPENGINGTNGNDGQDGTDGTSSYLVIRWRRTGTTATPAAPTSNSDPLWTTNYVAPTSPNNTHVWMAFKAGEGTDPNNNTGWVVVLWAQFGSTPGQGGSTTPTQDHAIYVAYGANEAQSTFTSTDFLDATRGRNITTGMVITPAPLEPSAEGPTQAVRRYAIAIPATKNLVQVTINHQRQRDAYAPDTAAVAGGTAPPTTTISTTSYKYYVSNQLINNTGQAYTIQTEDA